MVLMHSQEEKPEESNLLAYDTWLIIVSSKPSLSFLFFLMWELILLSLCLVERLFRQKETRDLL